MNDDGVELVALDHADIEEAGIFGVHGGMDETAIGVAMILRRLNKANLGIGKARDQIDEPSGIDHIVGIDDANDLSIGCGLHHRKPECCGLEPLEVFDAQKLETRTEFAAAGLDRLPERRIRRVVDDNHAFKIRVFEPRHRIDGAQQHLRRLPVSRNMDRDLWRGGVRARRRYRQQPLGIAAKSHRRQLAYARKQNRSEQPHQRQPDAERNHLAMQEIMGVPVAEHAGAPIADHMVGAGKQCHLSNGRPGKQQNGER